MWNSKKKQISCEWKWDYVWARDELPRNMSHTETSSSVPFFEEFFSSQQRKSRFDWKRSSKVSFCVINIFSCFPFTWKKFFLSSLDMIFMLSKKNVFKCLLLFLLWQWGESISRNDRFASVSLQCISVGPLLLNFNVNSGNTFYLRICISFFANRKREKKVSYVANPNLLIFLYALKR